MSGLSGQREDEKFLSEQIITYLGNKRSLLHFLGQGVSLVRQKIGDRRLRSYDAFSGSGIVSRFLKQHSKVLYTNDLEDYARVLNACYLSNASQIDGAELASIHRELLAKIEGNLSPGLISREYAPLDDENIQAGERVFYTRKNALFIDSARRCIAELPGALQPYFLAPLLYEASVHTNTSGVFKGFYKNKQGLGQFGGAGRNALSRIMGEMQLSLPLFSRFESEVHLMLGDATEVARQLPELDLCYLDPPYNQHPYGSNYFMLNLIASGKGELGQGEDRSCVSGIPTSWNRSDYNVRRKAHQALQDLVEACPSRFVMLSYNSEGIMPKVELLELLGQFGAVQCLEMDYPAFRGSRNLGGRALKVQEYLFLLEK